jgi:diketogulonate reductase-like aldo/keto reductase
VLRVDDEQTAPVVESALAAGYRHIDGPTRAGHDPRTFSYS